MPRVVDHDQRRKDIARIVEDLVMEQGIEALTIRDVAERAGFSTTVVCHYFRTKRDMLIFTQKEARERALQRVQAAREGGELLLGCMEILLPDTDARWRDWHTWFAFWGLTPAEPTVSTQWREAVDQAHAVIVELIREAQLAGTFAPERDPACAAMEVQLVINGIATLAMQDSASWPAARQHAVLRDQLLRIGYRG